MPKKPLIVIDPGHGGDPGALSEYGTRESDLNLSLAKAFIEAASFLNDYDVQTLRDSDVFIPLKERANKVNALNPTAVLSFHCNASQNRDASGFEVFTSVGQTKADSLATHIYEALYVVMPYNGRADFDDGDPVVRVLNTIQRARRDTEIAEELALYRDKVRRQGRLYQQAIAGMPEADRQEALLNHPQVDEMQRLADEANRIYLGKILPDAIRFGLKAIEGMTLDDGSQVTVDSLLEYAPTDLIEEIGTRCEEASGLSADERKNSESPTTSPG